MDDRADLALGAAEAGARVAADAFRGSLDVEAKDGKTDVVTQTDRDAQGAVLERIREAYPEDPVVAEEADDTTERRVPEEGPAWVVDPIDGTANFVRGVRQWATSVAATDDGSVVGGATVCPALGDTYHLADGTAYRNGEELSVSDRTDPEAFTVVPTVWPVADGRGGYADACRGILERFGDIRRFGSTQLELALCAAGAVEGVLTNVRPQPWDSLVGVGLVEAAGGVVTDVEGEPWRHDSRGLVASNGARHDEVLEAARAIDGDD